MPLVIIFILMMFLPFWFIINEPDDKRERSFMFSSCNQLLQNIKEKELPDYCVNIFKQLSDPKK